MATSSWVEDPYTIIRIQNNDVAAVDAVVIVAAAYVDYDVFVVVVCFIQYLLLCINKHKIYFNVDHDSIIVTDKTS